MTCACAKDFFYAWVAYFALYGEPVSDRASARPLACCSDEDIDDESETDWESFPSCLS